MKIKSFIRDRTTLHMDQELMQEIDECARKMQRSRSFVVRLAVRNLYRLIGDIFDDPTE
jgi:predicted transcriptional regulator